MDTLAALTKAVARVEGRVEELADAAEAAADRAERAAQTAAGHAEGVADAARSAFSHDPSLQVEAQTINRAVRTLDESRARLAEVPVPAWKWLLGSAAAGAVLAVAIEAAVWPVARPVADAGPGRGGGARDPATRTAGRAAAARPESEPAKGVRGSRA